MTMTTMTLERRDDVFSDPELRTLAGFLGGYSGLTRDAYSLDLRQFVKWTQTRHVALFDVARATSRGSPAIWRISVGRERQSRGGCARSPASTATRSKKGCSIGHRQCTSADRAWITSRMPLGWTATRSGRCSSPPGCRVLEITP